MKDLLGFIFSCVYIFLTLLVGQLLHQKGILSPKGLRKWIHLLAGSWVLPCLYLFERWYWAVLLPLIFVGVNLWGRKRLPLSFGTQEKFGPVYFPVSFVVLISLFWDWPLRWVACDGILIMAWADAAAGFVGERWGRHPFSLLGSRKSMEGSLTMLAVSFLTCWIVFGFLARFPLSVTLLVGSAVSVVATAMEALSGRGLDNITVPLSSALVAYFILFGPG